ncbi:hypothetical protein LTR08_006678 [Meristemomyces frigidus]|nr:hypothetical protein LTR08_006678 [Meristemomyces frigidus]
MSKMWEVDPETRSKLLEIQKTRENKTCVDCGAPSPQWISPKFGIFFCLACSGIHRSLGVHISFVRSATMDALKTGEVRRMELGGNRPWKDFFTEHASNKTSGRDFEGCTISERYDSEAGEEWKERLTAKVEGTEYVPGTSKPARAPVAKKSAETPTTSGRNTPLSKVASPPQRTASPAQKERNEAYFARMGNANASRPEDLAPAQGGKYAGFGSSPTTASNGGGASSGSVPSADDFQKDPVAALTKGFGWLSSTVSKQVGNVNKAYIQPGVKSLQDGELAAQAQRFGTQLGSSVQQGTKGLGQTLTKFIDPDDQGHAAGPAMSGTRGSGKPEKADFWDSFGADPAGPPKEKKEFWDDFAAVGEQAAHQQQKAQPAASSIGTSAMKNTSPSGATAAGRKEEGDGGWKDW